MLETSYGLTFFLKSPQKKTTQIRYIYLRVTVDGIPKETSTKMKWDARRWDQDSGRAVGTKEDARTLNFFLESLITKVNQFKTELINEEQTITANGIIDFVKGKTVSKAKVLEEFQLHNDEMKALIKTEEVAKGTHTRYVTARSHVHEFILFKYKKDDLEFRELNYEFVTDYEFYLKTVRNCSNNTTLKYISNLKKIVLRAIAKEIISKDPFTLFKGKKVKIKKYPLTKAELDLLENKKFSSERLATIRDIFIFQCYTGLAYIDVYQLKKDDIKQGVDGQLWIMSNRQKTKSNTDIPLLPKAMEIMEKYKNNPVCVKKGIVLPVKSNQKMNEYLKEVAELSNVYTALNTHKARRTFASTVTLNNGVPIHVVKELLGHHSVRQTEEYAITEHESISKEMTGLGERLSVVIKEKNDDDLKSLLEQFGNDLEQLKENQLAINPEIYEQMLFDFGERLNALKVLNVNSNQPDRLVFPSITRGDRNSNRGQANKI
ncbi:site-specific integrase [Chryseobacterium glaciei]|uniref:site-specific integrase n=1 Tax=Chryseobacterium glaciei TaxID=1685010 RepID=UPI00082FC90A|nr:site-specific integrase [Chryseobacterium glaciei]